MPPGAATWALLWLRGQAGARLARGSGVGAIYIATERSASQSCACCRSWPPPTAPGTGHPRARAAAFAQPRGRGWGGWVGAAARASLCIVSIPSPGLLLLLPPSCLLLVRWAGLV